MSNLLSLLGRKVVKVGDLERIYAANRERPSLAADAINAVRQLDSAQAWRAVWLLKRLAREHRLGEEDLMRLIECVEALPHWASRLNLCQLFSMTGCPAAAREALYPYLVECFSNRRVMIRAWAISALVEFRTEDKYRKAVTAMLRQAREDTGNSMKARLRLLAQENGWHGAAWAPVDCPLKKMRPRTAGRNGRPR